MQQILETLRLLAREGCRREEDSASCLMRGIAREAACLSCRAQVDLASSGGVVQMQHQALLSGFAIEVLVSAQRQASDRGSKRVGALDMLGALVICGGGMSVGDVLERSGCQPLDLLAEIARRQDAQGEAQRPQEAREEEQPAP